MDEKWQTSIIALVLAIVSTIFAVIRQYTEFGDEAFAQILEPISIVIWVGGFCIAFLFWWVVFISLKRWKKRKK